VLENVCKVYIRFPTYILTRKQYSLHGAHSLDRKKVRSLIVQHTTVWSRKVEYNRYVRTSRYLDGYCYLDGIRYSLISNYSQLYLLAHSVDFFSNFKDDELDVSESIRDALRIMLPFGNKTLTHYKHIESSMEVSIHNRIRTWFKPRHPGFYHDKVLSKYATREGSF